MFQPGHTHHANFLLSGSRTASIVLPQDITVEEADMIAGIITGVAARSSGNTACHAAAA